MVTLLNQRLNRLDRKVFKRQSQVISSLKVEVIKVLGFRPYSTGVPKFSHLFCKPLIMKTIIFTLSVFILTSCSEDRKFTMKICSGHDFTYNENWVRCDSFQMVTQNEAFIWVDGHKMKIIGDRGIKPMSN